MTRSAITAFSFWLLLAFIVWNVRFDRSVSLAAVAFTREQTLNRQQGRPLVSIDAAFSPAVRAAAVGAGAWAGTIVALGAILVAVQGRAARRGDRRSPPP
jgi:hypothetical protein